MKILRYGLKCVSEIKRISKYFAVILFCSICSINGVPVKGEKKTSVAAMIQKAEGPIKIGFNVLHTDPKQVVLTSVSIYI